VNQHAVNLSQLGNVHRTNSESRESSPASMSHTTNSLIDQILSMIAPGETPQNGDTDLLLDFGASQVAGLDVNFNFATNMA